MNESSLLHLIGKWQGTCRTWFEPGELADRGFQVSGQYDVGKDQPAWRWRTEFQWIDKDHVVMIAYNISPSGEEAKALETVYRR